MSQICKCLPTPLFVACYKKTAQCGQSGRDRKDSAWIKSWLNPLIWGSRACVPSQATVPSVFVKIRSPNHPPHRLGHPRGQKNLLRSPRLTFFSRRLKFRPKYQIHPLSGAAGWGLLFPVGTKNANNNFLCGCLAETGAMTHNKKSCNIQNKNNKQQREEQYWNTLNFLKWKGHWH